MMWKLFLLPLFLLPSVLSRGEPPKVDAEMSAVVNSTNSLAEKNFVSANEVGMLWQLDMHRRCSMNESSRPANTMELLQDRHRVLRIHTELCRKVAIDRARAAYGKDLRGASVKFDVLKGGKLVEEEAPPSDLTLHRETNYRVTFLRGDEKPEKLYETVVRVRYRGQSHLSPETTPTETFDADLPEARESEPLRLADETANTIRAMFPPKKLRPRE